MCEVISSIPFELVSPMRPLSTALSSPVFAQHHPRLYLHSLRAGTAIWSPFQQLRSSALVAV